MTQTSCGVIRIEINLPFWKFDRISIHLFDRSKRTNSTSICLHQIWLTCKIGDQSTAVVDCHVTLWAVASPVASLASRLAWSGGRFAISQDSIGSVEDDFAGNRLLPIAIGRVYDVTVSSAELGLVCCESPDD